MRSPNPPVLVKVGGGLTGDLSKGDQFFTPYLKYL
jgi:hypothetical protein